MKAKDLERAHKLFEELVSLQKDRGRIAEHRYFKLGTKKETNGSYEPIGHCDGVSEDYDGSYGQLASDLKITALRYYDNHIQRISSELKEMGVTP